MLLLVSFLLNFKFGSAAVPNTASREWPNLSVEHCSIIFADDKRTVKERILTKYNQKAISDETIWRAANTGDMPNFLRHKSYKTMLYFVINL